MNKQEFSSMSNGRMMIENMNRLGGGMGRKTESIRRK